MLLFESEKLNKKMHDDIVNSFIYIKVLYKSYDFEFIVYFMSIKQERKSNLGWS